MRKLRPETAVILPIRPEYVKRIRLGEKRVEFRKTIWDYRNEIKRIYIYESTPVSAIVGYFEIAKILRGAPDTVYAQAGLFAGIGYEAYKEYSATAKLIHGIVIKKPVFFNVSVPLDLIDSEMKAPQSFFYCSKETEEKILTLSKRAEEIRLTDDELNILTYIRKHGCVKRNDLH